MAAASAARHLARTVRPARLVLLVVLAAPAVLVAQRSADDRQPTAVPAGGRIVQETWEAAYLEGVKAGYVHYTVREQGQGDKKLGRATQELNLSVRRFGQVAVIHAE